VNRLARAETWLALAALVLAVLASLYLVISMFGANEICYGISSRSVLCTPLKPGTVEYAQATGRLLFVLVTVLVLYAGGALGAWGHVRAKEPSARSASLGLLCACAFFILGLTIPAIAGAGFFLIPSTTLVSLAAILGLVRLLQETRAQAKEAN
jgi:hypothetical protein